MEWWLWVILGLTWLPVGAIGVRLLRFLDSIQLTFYDDERQKAILSEVFFWLGYLGFILVLLVIFVVFVEFIVKFIMLLLKYYWLFVSKIKGVSKIKEDKKQKRRIKIIKPNK